MQSTKKFNKRAFVSVAAALSFIGLPFSGLMVHKLALDPLTIEKHLWMSVHNILGFLFLVFAIWHIKLNWKPLTNYVRTAASKFLTRETILAASIIAFFLLIGILHSFHLRP